MALFWVSCAGRWRRPSVSSDKAEGEHQHQIHQQKQSAAVLGRQIREPPEVSHAHRTARGSQHKADLPGKVGLISFP